MADNLRTISVQNNLGFCYIFLGNHRPYPSIVKHLRAKITRLVLLFEPFMVNHTRYKAGAVSPTSRWWIPSTARESGSFNVFETLLKIKEKESTKSG